MKKIRLKALELGAKEVLTRDQLKQILGGDGSGGSGIADCACDSPSTIKCPDGTKSCNGEVNGNITCDGVAKSCKPPKP